MTFSDMDPLFGDLPVFADEAKPTEEYHEGGGAIHRVEALQSQMRLFAVLVHELVGFRELNPEVHPFAQLRQRKLILQPIGPNPGLAELVTTEFGDFEMLDERVGARHHANRHGQVRVKSWSPHHDLEKRVGDLIQTRLEGGRLIDHFGYSREWAEIEHRDETLDCVPVAVPIVDRARPPA